MPSNNPDGIRAWFEADAARYESRHPIGTKARLAFDLLLYTGVRGSDVVRLGPQMERDGKLVFSETKGNTQIAKGHELPILLPLRQSIDASPIEKSCTSAMYSDRKLGVSETIATSAATIHFFTGNNIGPRGDLASRSLIVRLAVDRPDPENRAFRHPDPIAWTEVHRGRIFLNQEEDNEDSVSLADVLVVLAEKWPNDTLFQAADVAKLANATGKWATEREHAMTLRDFLSPGSPSILAVTAKATGKRLKRHVDEPVPRDGKILSLKQMPDTHAKISNFYIASRPNAG